MKHALPTPMNLVHVLPHRARVIPCVWFSPGVYRMGSRDPQAIVIAKTQTTIAVLRPQSRCYPASAVPPFTEELCTIPIAKRTRPAVSSIEA